MMLVLNMIIILYIFHQMKILMLLNLIQKFLLFFLINKKLILKKQLNLIYLNLGHINIIMNYFILIIDLAILLSIVAKKIIKI